MLPMPLRSQSLRGFGRGEFPVRIAGTGVAGERPNVVDLHDFVWASIDHRPGLVACRGDQLGGEMDFDFGGPAIQPGIVDHHLVDRNEGRRNLLAAPFTLGESSGKTLENFGGQKVSQNLAVPFGESGDNHLIRGFGAFGKGLDGKGRIGGGDAVEPRPGLRAWLGIWFPSVVLAGATATGDSAAPGRDMTLPGSPLSASPRRAPEPPGARRANGLLGGFSAPLRVPRTERSFHTTKAARTAKTIVVISKEFSIEELLDFRAGPCWALIVLLSCYLFGER